jgi:hypothetical protein
MRVRAVSGAVALLALVSAAGSAAEPRNALRILSSSPIELQIDWATTRRFEGCASS